jgi:hypothetical protein
MLKDMLSSNGKPNVSFSINEAALSLARVVANTATEISDLAERSIKGSSAEFADTGNLVFGTHGGSITESSNFLKWFGDSKVVDADGKPLVVYHGTASDFTEFKLQETSSKPAALFGHFFSADKGFASGYGKTMEVYLAIKNPKIISIWDIQAMQGKRGGEAQRLAAIKEGYDGAMTADGKVIVAFNPNQIKSATGNNGNFDANNNDIRYSKSKPNDSGTVTAKIKEEVDAGNTLGSILFALDRNHIVKLYGDKIKNLSVYKNLQDAKTARHNDLQTRYDALVQEMRKLPKQVRDQLATIAHEATILGHDPSENYTESDSSKSQKKLVASLEGKTNLTDKQKGLLKELKSRLDKEPIDHKNLANDFGLLPVNAQELFKKMRDAHRTQAKDLFNALEGNIERMAIPEESKRESKKGIVGYKYYVAAVNLNEHIHEVKIEVDLVRGATRERGYCYDQIGDVVIGEEVGSTRATTAPSSSINKIMLKDLPTFGKSFDAS